IRRAGVSKRLRKRKTIATDTGRDSVSGPVMGACGGIEVGFDLSDGLSAEGKGSRSLIDIGALGNGYVSAEQIACVGDCQGVQYRPCAHLLILRRGWSYILDPHAADARRTARRDRKCDHCAGWVESGGNSCVVVLLVGRLIE